MKSTNYMDKFGNQVINDVFNGLSKDHNQLMEYLTLFEEYQKLSRLHKITFKQNYGIADSSRSMTQGYRIELNDQYSPKELSHQTKEYKHISIGDYKFYPGDEFHYVVCKIKHIKNPKM